MSEHSQFKLLQTRRFAPFFITQFLGAFNDNLFKNALVVLLTYRAAQWTDLSPVILANLAAGVFILPFFLFSASAGQLADKYDKARLARAVKALEIAIMLLVGLGFWRQSLTLLFVCLFLFGLHSTLFGPVKYAILPQHLRAEEIVGGNALVEAGTFVAILSGTLAGGLLAGLEQGELWISLCGLLAALAGYGASRCIPPAVAPEPSLRLNPNPLRETWRNIDFARENPAVFLAILGISWFWLFGAIFLAQFPAYAKDILGGDAHCVTLLLAVFTLGIGTGSLLCESLSDKRIELGLVPFGALGLALFSLDFASAMPVSGAASPSDLSGLLQQPETWRSLIDLLGIGIFGGLFVVPLYATMQIESKVRLRSRIVAANNIFNALFMVVGALVAAGLLAQGWSIKDLFVFVAVAQGAMTVYVLWRLSGPLLRFLCWLSVRLAWRLELRGLVHLPMSGGAVLVCRGLNRFERLLLQAALRRPMRFLEFVPASGRNPPYDSAEEAPCISLLQALQAGELVVVRGDLGRAFAALQDTSPNVAREKVPHLMVRLETLGTRRTRVWLEAACSA